MNRRDQVERRHEEPTEILRSELKTQQFTPPFICIPSNAALSFPENVIRSGRTDRVMIWKMGAADSELEGIQLTFSGLFDYFHMFL